MELVLQCGEPMRFMFWNFVQFWHKGIWHTHSWQQEVALKLNITKH